MSAIQQIVASYRPSGPLAFRYWRLYITQNGGDASYVSLSEVQLRETAGVAATTSVVAYTEDQSHISVYAPDRLYNGSTTEDGWIARWGGTPVAVNFDLGVAKAIQQVALAPQYNASGRAPFAFYLLASNDSIAGPYSFQGVYTGASYSNGELTAFPVPYGV